jgi:hypothetical protein
MQAPQLNQIKSLILTVREHLVHILFLVDSLIQSEIVSMEHETKSQMEETKSMYTNPALPVTVPAFGGYGGLGAAEAFSGFRPADAALVQSNNITTLTSQMALQNQMLVESINRNSKENALLVKDSITEALKTSGVGIFSNPITAQVAASVPSSSDKLIENIILLSLVTRLLPPITTPPAA